MKIVQKKTLEKLNVFKGFLAHLPGFEPGTFRLGGGRSILLSYKCIFGFFSTIDLSLRRRTLYPAELRVHYLTGVIVALQTEVVKSKTVEAQIYPGDVSPMINTSTVKPFKYLFTIVI